MTLVVHYLQHLPDECRKLGPLDTFSCFKYENTLKSLKMRCRSFKSPMSNLANQLRIKSTFVSKASRAFMTGKPVTTLKRQHEGSGLLAGEYYQTVVHHHHILTIKDPDCYFYTRDKAFYKISEIVKTELGVIFICWRFTKLEAAYSIPTAGNTKFESSVVGVFKLLQISEEKELVEISRFARKCVVHNIYGQEYVYPML